MSYRRPLCEVSVLGSICPVGLGPGDIPTLRSPCCWALRISPPCVPPAGCGDQVAHAVSWCPFPRLSLSSSKSLWLVTTLPYQGACALPP